DFLAKRNGDCTYHYRAAAPTPSKFLTLQSSITFFRRRNAEVGFGVFHRRVDRGTFWICGNRRRGSWNREDCLFHLHDSVSWLIARPFAPAAYEMSLEEATRRPEFVITFSRSQKRRTSR